jgi:hypothetical protein
MCSSQRDLGLMWGDAGDLRAAVPTHELAAGDYAPALRREELVTSDRVDITHRPPMRGLAAFGSLDGPADRPLGRGSRKAPSRGNAPASCRRPVQVAGSVDAAQA